MVISEYKIATVQKNKIIESVVKRYYPKFCVIALMLLNFINLLLYCTFYIVLL